MGDCPICSGRGVVVDYFASRMTATAESQPSLKLKTCPECHGTGWTPRPKDQEASHE